MIYSHFFFARACAKRCLLSQARDMTVSLFIIFNCLVLHMKTWRLLLLMFQVTNIIHRCLSPTCFTLTLQTISSLRKKGSWLWWAGLLLENLCCGAIRWPLHSRETHQFFHFSSEDLKVWEFSGKEHFWVFIVKVIKRDLAVKLFCAFICPAVQIESIPLLPRFAGREHVLTVHFPPSSLQAKAPEKTQACFESCEH